MKGNCDIPPLTIRKADKEDIDAIMGLIAGAKRFMRSNGNMTQWAGAYPSREDIEDDIVKSRFYLIEDSDRNKPVMCFAVMFTPDPFYSDIRDGQWIDADSPYITIHRMASSGEISRLSDLAFAYCDVLSRNVRVDTHADNRQMLAAIERAGFKRCGIVTVADGTPRIAFQKIRY